MKKICVGLNQAIKLLYGIAVMIILCLILFRAYFIQYGYKNIMNHSQAIYLLAGICIWCVIVFGEKITLRHIPENIQFNLKKRADKYVFMLSILLGVLLIYIVYNYYFDTGWDSATLINSARVLASGNSVDGEYENWYFSSFPNNILLVDLFAVIIKVGLRIGIQNAGLSVCIVQCMEMAATGYLVYCITYELTEKKRMAFQSWVLYFMTVGISPWIAIPYSDSIGLMFPVLILYLFLRLKSKKYIHIKCLLIGALAWTGYKIKPQLFIVFLAIIIVELLNVMKNRQNTIQELKKIIISIVGVVGAAILITGIINITPIERNSEGSFGALHFMMMGLNAENNGGFSLHDVEVTSEKSGDERSSTNLQIIKERITYYGVKGMLEHLEKKILTNYADGTWAWGKEGDFYSQYIEDRNASLSPLLKSFYYQNGSNYHYYQAYAQAMWLLILLGCFCSFVKVMGEKESSAAIIILLLVFLGLTIFELLFEARARYLFSNVPLYIILANWGLVSMENQLVSKYRNYNNMKGNMLFTFLITSY